MKYIFFSTHITTRQSLAVYPMSVWCLEVELLWGPSGRFGDLALPSSATPPLSHGLGSGPAMWRLSLLLVWFSLSSHSSVPSILFLKFILTVSIETFSGPNHEDGDDAGDKWRGWLNSEHWTGRSGHWRNPLRQNLSTFPATSGKQLSRLCFSSGYSYLVILSPGLKS